MNPDIRLRFAPSPTGPLHIGSARTALFNWLFARRHGGTFILRIEDTDQTRYQPQSLEDIIQGLRWLGLDWDEGPEVGGAYGPYFQSQRTDLYHKWVMWLVEHDYAYKCWCTPERLAEVRYQKQKTGSGRGYDRHCRYLSEEEKAAKERSGTPFVVRFKIPNEGSTTIYDQIRGDITFEHTELEDLVLLKSDGFPTYHLANVVDDHFMKISHIVRADEWISTAPLHALMYQALGWEMPLYAHAPLILNPDGKGKLSKRQQAFERSGEKIMVQVREFEAAGFLPEAITNFLCNVGWAYGDDQEVFSIEDATKRFDLKQVNPAPARFPYTKLVWLNSVYIRNLSDTELANRSAKNLEEAGYIVDHDRLLLAAPLVRERLKTLGDVSEWLGFLFVDKLEYDAQELVGKKMEPEASLDALQKATRIIEMNGLKNLDQLEIDLRQVADDTSIKAGQLFGIIRIALSGQKVAPPLFGTMLALGIECTLDRLRIAIDRLAEYILQETDQSTV